MDKGPFDYDLEAEECSSCGNIVEEYSMDENENPLCLRCAYSFWMDE